MNDKNEFLINEEMVAGEGEAMLDRELTDKEIKQVFEAIEETWIEFVQERIGYVDDFNDLLDRNKNADLEPVHFDTYHRNANAYQFQFELTDAFKTEKDAREYIKHSIVTEYDEWKIVRSENGRDTIVWSINVK